MLDKTVNRFDIDRASGIHPEEVAQTMLAEACPPERRGYIYAQLALYELTSPTNTRIAMSYGEHMQSMRDAFIGGPEGSGLAPIRQRPPLGEALTGLVTDLFRTEESLKLGYPTADARAQALLALIIDHGVRDVTAEVDTSSDKFIRVVETFENGGI